MTDPEPTTETMRTVRFRNYGEPADVLTMETVPVPTPGPGRIRIAVHAVGLTPADWALRRGLFAGELPRGIGIEVSGTVDAIGDGVTDVAIGDPVFGTADWRGASTAGASDRAIMDHWTSVPAGLDLVEAAGLPMALETAYRSLAQLGLTAGQTVLVHGAGSTIGYAAVQIALIRGLRVVATAGPTYAQRLRDLGALVTRYGEGVVERVAAISGGPVDLVLDTAPVGGALPDLIAIACGDPKRVLTISDFAAAADLGVRTGIGEDYTLRFDVFPEFAQLAAERRFSVPIARTFPLEEWKTALETSESGHARGKLLLLTENVACGHDRTRGQLVLGLSHAVPDHPVRSPLRQGPPPDAAWWTARDPPSPTATCPAPEPPIASATGCRCKKARTAPINTLAAQNASSSSELAPTTPNPTTRGDARVLTGDIEREGIQRYSNRERNV